MKNNLGHLGAYLLHNQCTIFTCELLLKLDALLIKLHGLGLPPSSLQTFHWGPYFPLSFLFYFTIFPVPPTYANHYLWFQQWSVQIIKQKCLFFIYPFSITQAVISAFQANETSFKSTVWGWSAVGPENSIFTKWPMIPVHIKV
jgi:hypothetical protein